ncbi:Gfo/Idh/MocA family protein [Limisphaera sp. VF-2]|jgi:predicted dehydrogenase|uniref:Gfo/Idh/MocA family protein n=1 Tax=Limisphaera sp. VF-2 TaxID=3400418 RepID=UPI001769D783
MSTYGAGPLPSRREFLRQSAGLLSAAALVRAVEIGSRAAESNTLRIALIGCGGRGSGAVAQALSTAGPTELWAVADFFPERARALVEQLRPRFGDRIRVTPERVFGGLRGYRGAMDSLEPGNVVILATPPAFRPIHFEYAVQRGLHVFLEKSFAVDAPGIRRVLRAGEEAARKGLKVATGLMSRHYLPLEEAMARVHEGALGELVTLYAYRMHGPVGLGPRPANMSELAWQIANYSGFTWLNGSFFVDWLIHNIDVCCWAKRSWPVSVQGMGGRQVRREPDQLYDHYMAEYTFADGTRMVVQGRHMSRCWDFFGVVLHGTSGCAVLGEGQPNPMLFRGHQPTADRVLWRYRGEPCDPYQREMDLFFEAIRQDRPYNEVERSAKSNLTAIMGRMACESGQRITWEEAMASTRELAPGLDQLRDEDDPPVKADPQGRYPIAMPGSTEVL